MNNQAKITISREQMAEVDARYPSPTQNAERVFNILRTEHPDLSNWELVCFSAMYLGLVGDEYPWMKMPVMAVNRLLHILHYKYPEKTNDTMGLGDEETHEDSKSKRSRDSSSNSEELLSDGKTTQRPKKKRKKPRKHGQSRNRVPDQRRRSGISKANLAAQENARRSQQRVIDSDRNEETS